MSRRFISKFILVFLGIGFLLTACGGTSSRNNSHFYNLAPIEKLPDFVQSSPEVVRAAYRFAIANPDVLQQLPCYCGCGSMGHTSNYACYISGKNPNGTLAFDNHAVGCSICVDITRDAMRMLDEGKRIKDIRSYIDQTYSVFGPSNFP